MAEIMITSQTEEQGEVLSTLTLSSSTPTTTKTTMIAVVGCSSSSSSGSDGNSSSSDGSSSSGSGGNDVIPKCIVCDHQAVCYDSMVEHYNDSHCSLELPEGLGEKLIAEGLIKEKKSYEMLEVDVEAPENTKLYFTNIHSWKQWNSLYRYYIERFAEKRINESGTMYIPEKRVAYINFYDRSDMLGALQFKKWSPKEAFQDPDKPAPQYAAFVVGLENWKITVIKDVALALLKARDLALKEQKDQPGIAVGWGIASYDTKIELEAALKKKKFILKCRNRTTIVAVQPYHAPTSQNANGQRQQVLVNQRQPSLPLPPLARNKKHNQQHQQQQQHQKKFFQRGGTGGVSGGGVRVGGGINRNRQHGAVKELLNDSS